MVFFYPINADEPGLMKTRSVNLWIVLGSLCVGLAVLGIFLPVLPTTPFLLLAAFCYQRGSKRFFEWLIHHPVLGAYIRSYREKRGMPLRHGLITVTLLWLTIGGTILAGRPAAWLTLLLLAVAAGVTIHLAGMMARGRGGAKLTEDNSHPNAIDTRS